MLKTAINYLLQLLYPASCIACRNDILDNNMLCLECWRRISFISPPYCHCCGKPFAFEITGQFLCGKCISHKPYFEQARYLFKFDAYSKRLVHAFKYSDQTYLAKIFIELLYTRFADEIAQYDLIIPVPMHWFKRMLRRYNQAAILASELAIVTQKPVNYDILQKTRWTKAQSRLRKSARQNNLKNSFTVFGADQLRGKAVILVDDVLTTGTTTKECCKLLKKHGAARVMVLTIAAT